MINICDNCNRPFESARFSKLCPDHDFLETSARFKRNEQLKAYAERRRANYWPLLPIAVVIAFWTVVYFIVKWWNR